MILKFDYDRILTKKGMKSRIDLKGDFAMEKKAKDKYEIPDEYEPISMWGYFGYEILFAIPVIGWIILLVFTFGGAKNINVRNFARSYFCIFIVAIVAIITFIVSGFGATILYDYFVF